MPKYLEVTLRVRVNPGDADALPTYTITVEGGQELCRMDWLSVAAPAVRRYLSQLATDAAIRYAQQSEEL